MFITYEMMGNYPCIIGEFKELEEAQEFIRIQALYNLEDVLQDDIELLSDEDFEAELQNQLSYFSIEEK